MKRIITIFFSVSLLFLPLIALGETTVCIIESGEVTHLTQISDNLVENYSSEGFTTEGCQEELQVTEENSEVVSDEPDENLSENEEDFQIGEEGDEETQTEELPELLQSSTISETVISNTAPSIGGPDHLTSTIGVAFESVITGSDPDGDILVTSVELPEGSSYDAISGILSWLPTQTGTSTIVFIVSDGNATTTKEVLLETLPRYVTHDGGFTFTCGDINEDGTIDLADIDVFSNFIFLGASISESVVTDLNADGFPDATDLAILVDYVTGDGIAPTCACGDTNRDNLLDQNDVNSYIDFIFYGGILTEGVESDFNGDGFPDATDLALLIDTVYHNQAPLRCGLAVAQNQNPEFSGFSPPVTVNATETYSYDVEATDSDDDTLEFSLPEHPEGMSIDENSGLITWIPAEEQATSTPYAVTVQVSDGQTAVTSTFSITVNPKPTSQNPGGNGITLIMTGGGGGGGSYTPPTNHPPVFVNFTPPLVTLEGQIFAYDAEAEDLDGDSLTYTLISGPSGIIVGYLNGIIFWVPDASFVGTSNSITVQVSDGKSTAEETFTLDVISPALVAPTIPESGETPQTSNEIVPPAPEDLSVENPPAPALIGSVDETQDQTPFERLLANLLNQYGAGKLWLMGLLTLLLIFLIFLLVKRRGSKEEKSSAVPTGAVSVTAGHPAEVILLNAHSLSDSQTKQS